MLLSRVKKFRLKCNTTGLFLASLLLIAVIFILTSGVIYRQFSQSLIRNELDNQQQVSQIIAQLLEHYFDRFKVITKNTVSYPEFDNSSIRKEEKILYQDLKVEYAKKIAITEEISTILSDPMHAEKINSPSASSIFNKKLEVWQLFKGLPRYDEYGIPIAKKKRLIIKKILNNDSDIRYMFYTRANGDIIFIEPHDIQKNITIFNYAFRDSLKLVKKNKETSISEAYISNDSHGTQSITVASPIMDKKKRVAAILGVSISAEILKKRVFVPLKNRMDNNDKTVFYLLDRHAHVVSSSSGKNIYFPINSRIDDENDPGNMRNYGVFKKITWQRDYFERGSFWNRKTFSWNIGSLDKKYQSQYKNIDGVTVIGTFIPISLDGRTLNWGILIETPLDQVLMSANYFKSIFYVSGSLLVLILIASFIASFRAFSKLKRKILQKEKEISRMTAQVVHDIRSPLVALDMLLENLNSIEEKKRIMVHKSITRISDIANNLLLHSKNNSHNLIINDSVPELLFLALDNIISEKRYEHYKKPVRIELVVCSNSYNCFSSLNLMLFKRVISNLVNNAIEATNYCGSVIVTLDCDEKNVLIVIKDDGCGIPSDILKKVGKPGFSFNKKNGNGYGLCYAKEFIENNNGTINIKSKENSGTKIEIILPRSDFPNWFCDSIQIKSHTSVVMIDDDPSIHDAWEEKLKIFPGVRRLHFYRLADFLAYKVDDLSSHLFLVDYELLNESKTGLDMIEELNLQNKSILVTSYFDVPAVRSRCEKIGLKIIPKNYVPYIQIMLVTKKNEIVLIDDDEVMRMAWSLAAEAVGEKIVTYSSPCEFNAAISNFNEETLLYIDSDLGSGIKGELFAKELYDKGFKNICITTGYVSERFVNMPWLKAVIGKEPSFLTKCDN